MRKAVGVLQQDAAIPEVVEGEERVLRWLRSTYGRVDDYRPRHKGFDFLIARVGQTMGRKADVKVDFHARETQRLAWEAVIATERGPRKLGWGQLALHWIIVVIPGAPLEDWTAYVCNGALWRSYIEDHVAVRGQRGDHLAEQAGRGRWVRFDMPNRNGDRGQGWAIPIAELRAASVIWKEVALCPIDS